jgi:hypothetical protein
MFIFDPEKIIIHFWRVICIKQTKSTIMKRHSLLLMLFFSIFFIHGYSTMASSELPPDNKDSLCPAIDSESALQQQSPDKAVQNAISSGNCRTLSSFFFSSIELSLPETQGTFSKTQAELLMKNFFSKHPPAGLTIINEGQSGGEKSRFAIGTYTTTSGSSFRMYYLMKEISGTNQLTILKFE